MDIGFYVGVLIWLLLMSFFGSTCFEGLPETLTMAHIPGAHWVPELLFGALRPRGLRARALGVQGATRRPGLAGLKGPVEACLEVPCLE